ncbi:hypothetical protein TNCT_170201 [Trichonephila clavata]|uniref:Uncharacterized protein n=1 Tax=Trichonephila clavata TaxID=2740835 RepID=A0A8X6J6Y2_TRICU|nr:hypothetical protein TNCT_170201 [Trichonephila clavata]
MYCRQRIKRTDLQATNQLKEILSTTECVLRKYRNINKKDTELMDACLKDIHQEVLSKPKANTSFHYLLKINESFMQVRHDVLEVRRNGRSSVMEILTRLVEDVYCMNRETSI